MKADGKYVARGLSFKDAQFLQQDVRLTREQEQVRPPAPRQAANNENYNDVS